MSTVSLVLFCHRNTPFPKKRTVWWYNCLKTRNFCQHSCANHESIQYMSVKSLKGEADLKNCAIWSLCWEWWISLTPWEDVWNVYTLFQIIACSISISSASPKWLAQCNKINVLYLSDVFSTILNHLPILYSFICTTHLFSLKKTSMSGHSGYSRESKNLMNLFDLFSRHSVGLKKKEIESNSSSGIWMDMSGNLRKLGWQCHYSFSSGISDTFAAFGHENLYWCNMLPRNLSHSSEHSSQRQTEKYFVS